MSSPINPRSAQPDEINIMDSAVKLARFARKHLVWVVLFPTLGIFGGFLNNLVQGRVYEADLMLRSRFLKSDEITFLMSNYERTYPGFSKAEKRRIRSMKFKATKEDAFVFGKVSFQTTDTLMFKKLQASITTFIEDQPSVHATTERANEANTSLINEYTATIRKAESLLEDRNVDPTQVYKNYRNIPDLTLLYERRRDAEINRRDSTAIVVVSDFAPQEYHLKKTLSLVIGFFIGSFAAVLMLFLIHFADYYHKTNDTAS
jgi:hypothetical protein